MTEEIKLFDMDVVVQEHVKQIAEFMSKKTDALLLASLVGSRILKFEIKPDKSTKHMYNLTIITDAKEVEVPQYQSLGKDGLIMAPNKVRIDPSIIKLRVRR